MGEGSGGLAVDEGVLQGESEVQPGGSVAQHGEEDEVGVEGGHVQQRPDIDASQIHEGHDAYAEECVVAEVGFVEVEAAAVGVVEVVVVEELLEAGVVGRVGLHL